MDVTALASTLTGFQAAQTQVAIADKLLQLSAQADQSVVKLLDAAQQNLANVAAGVGTQVNITA